MLGRFALGTLGFLIALLSAGRAGGAAPLLHASPSAVDMNAERLDAIDGLVRAEIEKEKLPGCVVLISRDRRVVFHRAYGHRQVQPEELPMEKETVFDMASLTKPIATATSIMQLVDRGEVRLADEVADYLDGFEQNGKQDITLEQMMTHQAGFVPDSPLREYAEPDNIWPHLYALELQYAPGTRFVYSDVGYQLLGKIVEECSGLPLHEFSRQNIFEPLGMLETGFLPSEELRERAATTEQREGRWMRGEVHDPRAYAMGGVAGHAGLFSTSEDLARYAHMMLDRGRGPTGHILSPAAVKKMTTAVDVAGQDRGLGWDMRSRYSSNRGELMSSQAFGHGGFTGTAMWIDPSYELVVIFLSNRVHPNGSGAVNRLAGRIGSVAVSSISLTQKESPTEKKPVLTGIDVLVREQFRALQGLRIGLITNHTGIDRRGRRTVDVLHEADNVELAAIFSPEHGLQGVRDDNQIGDATDEATGLPIFSLYGERRSPSATSLESIDALVFDIQDIGCRFYTYISTMNRCMKAADETGKRFFVLDRPNPIGGVRVEGPILDEGLQSFVGCHTIPVRHGMTVGELAKLFATEQGMELRPEVVLVENWFRNEYFDQTGLRWVDPSPNMRSLTEAVLYPGVGLLETTNLSVGRGTDRPFEIVGAPYVDGVPLARRLNQLRLAGVSFVPREFVPEASKFKGEVCGGIDILITDRAQFQSVHTGLAIAKVLRDLYPDEWETERYLRLLGDRSLMRMVESNSPLLDWWRVSKEQSRQFLDRRSRHLLYE